MANPILVTLTRGALVESFHRGAVAFIFADGEPHLILGDVDRTVYPRSAIKVLQALPLVESGAADAAGLTDKELALACASHSGEPFHIQAVQSILKKSGLVAEALSCGAHWPTNEEAARQLAVRGEKPGPLHNNCSGKHAGMLTLAKHIGANVAGYEKPDHPVQQLISKTIQEVTGHTISDEVCAIDGCSVPTWAVPLRALAHAFARLATGAGMTEIRQSAAERLFHACTNEPLYVEGTGRFGAGVMQRLGGAAFMKGGAEGVYCAAFPELGVGMALKIDDGAKRGAEAAAAFMVAAFLKDKVKAANDLYDMTLTNWGGQEIGEIVPSKELLAAFEEIGL